MRKLSRFLFLFVKKVKNNKINMHAYETAYAFSSENDTCKVHLGKKTKELMIKEYFHCIIVSQNILQLLRHTHPPS